MVDFRTHVNRILKHAVTAFGEDVIVYPKAGGVYKIRGVFDNDYQAVDPDTEKTISANLPALGINLNDVSVDLAQGDQVKVRGTMFVVSDKREDGQGGAVLFLQKVRARDRFGDTRASEA